MDITEQLDRIEIHLWNLFVSYESINFAKKLNSKGNAHQKELRDKFRELSLEFLMESLDPHCFLQAKKSLGNLEVLVGEHNLAGASNSVKKVRDIFDSLVVEYGRTFANVHSHEDYREKVRQMRELLITSHNQL